MTSSPRFTLIAASASQYLRAAVEHGLGRRFAAATIQRFPDGEVCVRLDEPVRGEEVILLAATRRR